MSRNNDKIQNNRKQTNEQFLMSKNVAKKTHLFITAATFFSKPSFAGEKRNGAAEV